RLDGPRRSPDRDREAPALEGNRQRRHRGAARPARFGGGLRAGSGARPHPARLSRGGSGDGLDGDGRQLSSDARLRWDDGPAGYAERRTLTPSESPAAASASAAGSAGAGRSAARFAAAPTNSRKSGSGRVGRELNSGWNCEATK